MEEVTSSNTPKKRRNPVTILLIFGIGALGLGVAGIIASRGIQFVTPLLTQPGPTGTMIQPATEVSNNLKQPGILGEIKAFEIEGSNFKFTPADIVANLGDTVQITFSNKQGMHNLAIDGLGIQTRTLQAGESDVITFTAEKKGTYSIYCSVGNHRSMGMVGTLTVN